MTKRKAQPVDPAELLTTPRAIATFISDARGDSAFIDAVLGVAARAKSRLRLARWLHRRT
jgi:DNA-binding phage protein